MTVETEAEAPLTLGEELPHRIALQDRRKATTYPPRPSLFPSTDEFPNWPSREPMPAKAPRIRSAIIGHAYPQAHSEPSEQSHRDGIYRGTYQGGDNMYHNGSTYPRTMYPQPQGGNMHPVSERTSPQWPQNPQRQVSVPAGTPYDTTGAKLGFQEQELRIQIAKLQKQVDQVMVPMQQKIKYLEAENNVLTAENVALRARVKSQATNTAQGTQNKGIRIDTTNFNDTVHPPMKGPDVSDVFESASKRVKLSATTENQIDEIWDEMKRFKVWQASEAAKASQTPGEVISSGARATQSLPASLSAHAYNESHPHTSSYALDPALSGIEDRRYMSRRGEESGGENSGGDAHIAARMPHAHQFGRSPHLSYDEHAIMSQSEVGRDSRRGRVRVFGAEDGGRGVDEQMEDGDDGDNIDGTGEPQGGMPGGKRKER